ncbi:hypothetical protein BJ742DRAFT_822777 [Cladochytrium replicatum]|nr:hypothetical protein BJ742DRAFT_822777 [Cladochytrium replicatum]
MSGADVLLERAREYIGLENNDAYRAEIQAFIDSNDLTALHARFSSRIAFGTAGLRAEMGAGYSRMNGVTVIQATQGVALHLLKSIPDARSMGVVIAHDHRHNSLLFSRLAASVLLSHNIKVHFLTPLSHTPLVPFGVTHLKAAAGVMITASHNPKNDNGYKLYWRNGCQIIPPLDEEIAKLIDENISRVIWDETLVDTSPLVTEVFEKVRDAYFEKVAGMSQFSEHNAACNVQFCYTAMHGVGAPFARKVFEIFGFKPFVEVAKQVEPDPDFPTVKYPNPEEGEGALALAMEAADAESARVILANDPDADRLAVAEKSHGHWVVFNGNEIGTMLGCFLWEIYGATARRPAMLASTVSSKLLARVAKVENFTFEETLTGFKWLGNRAIDQESKGHTVLFAYEEAIGFMVGDTVHDKDGVSALATLAELVAWLERTYKRGTTLSDWLEIIYKKYGYFVSYNTYFVCHSAPTIKALFNRIRYSGSDVAMAELGYPTYIGPHKVIGVRDLTIGYDSEQPDKKPLLPVSSSSEMVTFKLDNECVFTLRTSGTEPKIKYYSEIRGSTKSEAEASIRDVVCAVVASLIEPERNALQLRDGESF